MSPSFLLPLLRCFPPFPVEIPLYFPPCTRGQQGNIKRPYPVKLTQDGLPVFLAAAVGRSGSSTSSAFSNSSLDCS